MFRILFVIIFLFNLNACFPITHKVWKKHAYVESFSGVSSEKVGTVILVGDKYNYVFADERRVFAQVNNLPILQSLNFALLSGSTYVKGNKFYSKMAIIVGENEVSDRQKQVLYLLGFQKNKGQEHYHFIFEAEGKRKEKGEQDLQIVMNMARNGASKMVLKEPNQIIFLAKTVITPVTFVADILFTPIYAVYYAVKY